MTRTPRSTPWWDTARHADRRPALLARNRIQAAIRTWFTGQDFVEVDPSA
ncbi:MAG: EF-P lysine aminoacylase GenX, partial [Rhodobacter sp.]|nr:EF-P lysine aminoacylase GenX [Rhodobacter sp.]